MKEWSPQNNNAYNAQLEKQAIFQKLRDLEGALEPTIDQKRALTDAILEKELKKEQRIKELEAIRNFLQSVEEGTVLPEDLAYVDKAPDLIKKKNAEIRILNEEIRDLENKRDFDKEQELNRLLDELLKIESS